MATAQKPLNLALQGGGAHGAYTWGVVDKLLEDGRTKINAITATSAGAMNAAAIAYGYHLDGPEGARKKLEEYWKEVSQLKNRMGFPSFTFPGMPNFFAEWERMASHYMMEAASITTSPYQFNPFGLNPLKELLNDIIDFDALNRCKLIDLFITATNVKTGKAKVWSKADLRAEHLMASACLPQLFQAVDIDGDYYWDGGFMGNPSLWPLFYETDVQDMLIVHINPIHRDEVPKSAGEITNRINEITFNTSLLKEMRAIAFVQKLLAEGWINEAHKGQLSMIRVHSIRSEKTFEDLGVNSKSDTSWAFLQKLREEGHGCATGWLEENWAHVGKRSSIDLREEFLDL